MHKAFILVAAIGAAGVGGYLAVRASSPALAEENIGQIPIPNDTKYAADEKALQEMQSAYVKAFNAADAKALAAFWAPDGEFVDADGRTFRGRIAIEKEFAKFFAETKGITLEVTTDSLRFVSPGVALESGGSRVKQASDGASTGAAYSIVFTKRDGTWQFASVREAAYPAASNYEHLRDLEWLVGTWTAKSAGRTLELTCEWAAQRNFLTRKYTVTSADGETKSGIQVIGWDPVLGRVRSWVFDSAGGFGSERWIKDGKRWVLEATAVTREGAQATSTNVMTYIDADTFTWQSVQRDVNHVRLPDTAALKVTRVKAKK
jgi:uncharacterized protein (TIGR02246 family)